ncbi:SMP-30/gluconolactonase/LRE family protein [Streptomyces sp. NBC_01217]|uniref:SMP-30/gluconolactonase/LRE family protein n=1 Tax=Streptomyces sp. NBC_01217 TaxID=2903779 RepID=UPI002E0E680B|nr:SMP-30/gluconolactonase/LRE family protein [Streptomyces sp. NBC_01217]
MATEEHIKAAKPRAGGGLVVNLRGSLARVAPDGAVTPVLPVEACANGIGWGPDGRLMYLIDTPTGRRRAAPLHGRRHPGPDCRTSGTAPTACAFGGTDLSGLCITSARAGHGVPRTAFAGGWASPTPDAGSSTAPLGGRGRSNPRIKGPER